MVVRAINFCDIEKVAEVHKVSFEGFFLTSLGTKFLKTYYKSCLKNNKTIALGVFDDQGSLKGFATGTVVALGYHRMVFLKNFFAFLKALFLVLIRRPGVAYRLGKNLNKSPFINDTMDYAELLSIAVLPELKGAGLGGVLLENFEIQAKALGASKVVLTTDFKDNDIVLAFYRKRGYQIYYDFITYPSRHMYKMIKLLD